MAYTAIYRKYRPKTFDKMIGQDHIVRTLVNQIESDKIGHAYLFCGTRGTGKTSTARIFARAINCLSPVNGSPCGECEVCRALEDPSSLDVVEIDAASNNGVNEIRDLREKIAYPPVSCRYKVYIIDEVHMLTAAAFNALLKTLEEPPKHAVFILATTEAHKLPATILSRCMRFDFKLISVERLAKLVGDIFDDLGRKYEKEALTLIAKAGEGSIRDALSIADVCDSYADGVLTYDDVLAVLGTSDTGKIKNLVTAVLQGDAGGVFACVDELASMGKSMGVLTKDVVNYLRDLLVAKTLSDPNAVLSLPEDRLAEGKEGASYAPAVRILRCMEIFSAAESELKYTTHPRILFETAAVKAAKPESDFTIDALAARVKTLEDQLAFGNFANVSANAVSKTENADVRDKKNAAATAPVPDRSGKGENGSLKSGAQDEAQENAQSGGAGALSSHKADEVMGVITRGLRQSGELMLWAIMQGLKGEIKGNTFIVTAKNDNDYGVLMKEENFRAIMNQLKKFDGAELKIKAETSAKYAEEFANDVDEIKRIFGDDIVIIE